MVQNLCFEESTDDDGDNLVRCIDENGSSVAFQKFGRPKAPGDADAVEAGILGCLDIDFRIADVYGVFRLSLIHI